MEDQITIYNSSSQTIGISARPPGSDFFRSEQQIWIAPHKTVVFLKSHINNDQVKNLCSRGMLRVITDTSNS